MTGVVSFTYLEVSSISLSASIFAKQPAPFNRKITLK